MMKHYITLIRPVNFVITGLSIYIACLLAGGTKANFIAMLFSSIGGALIGAGGMVINDIFDVEIDKINKPHRPIASGAIDKFDAMIFYGALSGAGVMMSVYASTAAFFIAFGAVPVIFMYSYWLKATPLAGNLVVAFMTGLAFIFGGAAVGNIQGTIVPALFAFLINAGREIIKDMEDVNGDAKNNVRTFPIVYGMKRAAVVATIFLLAVIVATIFPFASGMYSLRYFIAVNIGVNAVIVFVLVSLWKSQTEKNLHLLATILKWDMLVGLVAIYLG